MLRYISIFLFTVTFVGCAEVADQESVNGGDGLVNRKVGKSIGKEFFDNIQRKSSPGQIDGLWVLESNRAQNGIAAQAYYFAKDKTSFAIQCNNQGTPVYSYVTVRSKRSDDTVELLDSRSYGARYIDLSTGAEMLCQSELAKGNRYIEVNGNHLRLKHFQDQQDSEIYKKIRDQL